MSSAAVKSFCKRAEGFLHKLPAPENPARWDAERPISEQYLCAYLLIDLVDLWGHFCRTLVLDLASGKAKDFSGNLIPNANPLIESDAISRVVNRRLHEPNWYQARDSIEAIRKLRVPYSLNVTAALSVASSPVKDMVATRNYFAHRRTDCMEKLKSSSFYQQDMRYCPYRIANYLLPTSKSVYESWVDELKIIAIACLK